MLEGALIFFRKKLAGNFLTAIFENPRFHYSKKAILKIKKQSMLWLECGSSVYIGE